MPKGRQPVTPKDAATYIIKLPKSEHTAPEWQAAMEALDPGGDARRLTMFASIGVMRALNRRRVREFSPDRKPPSGESGS
jgi:hypothetical protein